MLFSMNIDDTIDRIVYVLDQLERRLSAVEDQLTALSQDAESTKAVHTGALAKQAETVSRGMLVLYDLIERSAATGSDAAAPSAEPSAAALMEQEVAALMRRKER